MENKKVYYYCVGTSEIIAPKNKEVYFYASEIRINENGDLIAINKNNNIDFALSKGNWNYLHSANLISGDYCGNIEHWE